MTGRPGPRPLARPLYLPHGEVQLHLLDLGGPLRPSGEEPASSLPADLDWLDDAEHLRAAQFQNPAARRRYVRARAGLRLLLGDYLGLPPARVPIVVGREGKPRLGPPEHVTQIGFSLSYAGRYSLLAFVRGREVGVDFEEVQAKPGLDGVAARFFAPQEQAALQRLNRSQQTPEASLRAFYRIWTRREAVLKALGSGLTAPTADLRVSVNEEAGGWLQESRAPGPPVQTWLTRDLHADPGYCAALAVPGGAGFRVRLMTPSP